MKDAMWHEIIFVLLSPVYGMVWQFRFPDVYVVDILLSAAITANVRTEGATDNFPIWTDFGFRDRFAFISRVSGRIIMVYSAFCQNDSSTISDRARFSKYQFISAT
jgi:hypothetical protein